MKAKLMQFMLYISAILPAFYMYFKSIPETISVYSVFIIVIILSLYVILTKRTLKYFTSLAIIIATSFFNKDFFLASLILWFLFLDNALISIVGLSLTYAIIVKIKVWGLTSLFNITLYFPYGLGLSLIDSFLILLGLSSVIILGVFKLVKTIDLGYLVFILGLVFLIEGILIMISWFNIVTSAITVFALSSIFLIRAFEKVREKAESTME